MSLIPMLFLFCFMFINISEANNSNNLPSTAIVVGSVYCNTCFQEDFSKKSHFISGASVAVDCRDENSVPSFYQEMKTDELGKFQVHLPFSVDRYVKIIGKCSVKLLNSSEPSCAVASKADSSSLSLKSRKEGIQIFSAGFLSFRPQQLPNICNQKPSIQNSEPSNSRRFSSAPVTGSLLQDPTISPVKREVLLQLPPFAAKKKLATGNFKKANDLTGSGTKKPNFFFPPNPFQPPSIFPPNPFQPPPLFPPLLPPNPFQPPPLIPNPFQPPPFFPPLLPPNPFQPPPLIPNPFQPPPLFPPLLPPNPFRPPPSPLFPFPPIPGLTPSPPPPIFPFPPLPPLFPLPPIPGLTPSPPPPPPPIFPFPPLPPFLFPPSPPRIPGIPPASPNSSTPGNVSP